MAESRKPRKKKLPPIPPFEHNETHVMMLLEAAQTCTRDALKAAARTAHAQQLSMIADAMVGIDNAITMFMESDPDA